MRDFRELKVWQKAHQVTLAVYKATTDFPKQEMYGLTSQMRRSAASVPTNIAEGCGRSGHGDFLRFLHIALGSANELDYQLLLAHDLNFLRDDLYEQIANETTQVKRMLTALIQKAPPTN